MPPPRDGNIFEVVPYCKQVQRLLFWLWVPIMLVILILSSIFMYISANSGDYGVHNWENCYLKGDYVHDPADASNTGFQVGTFADSLSYQGVQTIVFATLALLGVETGLTQSDWLPSSIVFSIFCALGTLTYYSATPVIPNPSRLSPSLVVFTYYARENLFDDLALDECGTAYSVLLFYLILQYMMFAIILASLAVAIRADIARRHTPRRRYYPRLEGMTGPAVVAFIVFLMYVLTMSTKCSASILALDCIADHYKHPSDGELVFESSLFPFKPGSLDLLTILQVTQLMYVTRGYSKLSVSAFKVATVIAMLALIAGWPSIIGVWKFYYANNLDSDEECKNYFLSDQNKAMYGYPSPSQAEAYCRDTRIAISAQFIMFVMYHIQVFASMYVYSANKDRPSEVYDPLDAPRTSTQQTYALLYGASRDP